MNKVGIHALVWAGSWGARECEYTVASSKEAGYDLVEFPVFQPAAMDIEAIQRALSAQRHDGHLLAGPLLRQGHQQRGPGLRGTR